MFRDGPRRTRPEPADFHWGRVAGGGVTRIQGPGRLWLRARNTRYLVHGTLAVDQGRGHRAAELVVGADNALVLAASDRDSAALYIGPTAHVRVQKDGALELRRYARLTIAGRLDVAAGAYFFRDSLARVRTVGRGVLRVAPGARRTKPPTRSMPDAGL